MDRRSQTASSFKESKLPGGAGFSTTGNSTFDEACEAVNSMTLIAINSRGAGSAKSFFTIVIERTIATRRADQLTGEGTSSARND